nr:probable glutamate receptor [Cherax quadricarinatus]
MRPRRHKCEPTALSERAKFVSMWVEDAQARALTEGAMLDAVLSTEMRPPCSVFIITDDSTSTSPTNTLRQVSWCVTVVVVSDDTLFLTAFAEWSLKGRLQVWSTRFLVVTRLNLNQLQFLHTTFSMTNSMFLIIEESSGNIKCNIYIHLPYSGRNSQALQVATWTTHRGLVLTSHLLLFPDKFSRFLHRPTLQVATEVNPLNVLTDEEEASVPSGKILKFKGPAAEVVSYLSEGVNFSYLYVRPPDSSWGIKREDGTWSGMVGMVVSQEVDFAVGPFGISELRAEVVDFTEAIFIDYWRILGARGRPEVDPWGFLFPLTPVVWAAILVALLVLPAGVLFMASHFPLKTDNQNNMLPDTSSYLRVLLQQDMLQPSPGTWWERVVLVVWAMVTFVLTRSYSGNLMALLAVRNIPEPYQSLRAVLDNPSVIMIWEKDSTNMQYFKSVESGIYREIADQEQKGRLIYRTLPEFPESTDTLVRRGDHVLMEVDFGLKTLISRDFTKSGQCFFYESREEFMPLVFAMVGQKDSPVVPALSKRIRAMTEAGLFLQWMKNAEPNYTVCYHAPAKITVETPLSLNNIWGMFAVFISGHALSLLVFFLEFLITKINANLINIPLTTDDIN